MNQLRAYSIVTGAYWSFMLTDGALRMLILLFFHTLGYSPVTLAFLFLFYEFFGIVTNLFGGWLAQRFGLKSTLIAGLILQPVALIALSFIDKSWAPAVAIPFVMIVQAISGIAKDLTKMSSKTAVKYLVPEDQNGKLFKLVAVLTGSKNAIKGLGFFVGGFLLSTAGYSGALWILAGIVIVALVGSLVFLTEEIGTAKSKDKMHSVLDQKPEIKTLSLARLFLFGARDIWFVVAVPVYLAETVGWSSSFVGTFMALWVIAYGIVQASAPKLLKRFTGGKAPTGTTAIGIAAILSAIMITMTTLFANGIAPEITIIGGLLIFGLFFALNSSVHSFLVLDYADGDKAATNVGFYYMANAGGRLVGTLLSGILFQIGGVTAALIGSTLFMVIVSLVSVKLPRK